MECVGVRSRGGPHQVDYPTPKSPRYDLPETFSVVPLPRVDSTQEMEQRVKIIERTHQAVAPAFDASVLRASLNLEISTLPEGGWAKWTGEVFNFDPFDPTTNDDLFLPVIQFLAIPRALEDYRAFVLEGGITTPRALIQLFYIMEYTSVLSGEEFEELTKQPHFLSLFLQTKQILSSELPQYGLFTHGLVGRVEINSPAHTLFMLLLHENTTCDWIHRLFMEMALDDAQRLYVLKVYHPDVDWDGVATLIGPSNIGAVTDMVCQARDMGRLGELFTLFGWGTESRYEQFFYLSILGHDLKFNISLLHQGINIPDTAGGPEDGYLEDFPMRLEPISPVSSEESEWIGLMLDFDPFDGDITECPFAPVLDVLKHSEARQQYKAFVLNGGITTPRDLLQFLYIMQSVEVLSEEEFWELSQSANFLPLYLQLDEILEKGLPNYGLFEEGFVSHKRLESLDHKLFNLLKSDSTGSFRFEELFQTIVHTPAGRLELLKTCRPEVEWDEVATLIGPENIGYLADMVEVAKDKGCLDELFRLFGWGDEYSTDLFELVQILADECMFNIPLESQLVITEESLGYFFEEEVTEATQRQFQLLYQRYGKYMYEPLRSNAALLVESRSEYMASIPVEDQMYIWAAYTEVKNPFIVKLAQPHAPSWWVRSMIARQYQLGEMSRGVTDEDPAAILLKQLHPRKFAKWLAETYPLKPWKETAFKYMKRAALEIVNFALIAHNPIEGLEAASLRAAFQAAFRIIGLFPESLEQKLAELEAKEGI